MNSFQRNIYRTVGEDVTPPPPTMQPILLGYSGSDSTTSCANIITPVTRYIPMGQDWMAVTFLYEDAAGTIPANPGFYSDGAKWYDWNGSSFIDTGFC